MSPSSNSVYSSVFTYNPYALTRPYRHLTFLASIEPRRITCVSHDISVSILGFGARARACRMDTPTSCQKRTRCPSTKVSWLFEELSDNNASYFTPFSNIVCRSTVIKRSIKQSFKTNCKTTAQL